MVPFIRNIQIDKSKKTESGFVVYRDWEENEERLLMIMDFFFFWGDENTLELDSGDGSTILWVY